MSFKYSIFQLLELSIPNSSVEFSILYLYDSFYHLEGGGGGEEVEGGGEGREWRKENFRSYIYDSFHHLVVVGGEGEGKGGEGRGE